MYIEDRKVKILKVTIQVSKFQNYDARNTW